MKKTLLMMFAVIAIVGSFTACKDKNQEKPNGAENQVVISGDKEEFADNKTYNNGGTFVKYKGKTYYREYSNADVEKTGFEGEYEYVTEVRSTKYINSISKDGTVENVFEDDGYGNFYIVDDRFFFTGYDNKLYSANMNGEDYMEICKGFYVGCDEENHRIFYKNQGSNLALYMIDTQNLKITKLSSEDLNVMAVDSQNVYFENIEDSVIKVMKIDIETSETSEVCNIEIGEVDEYDTYVVADFERYEDKLFVSSGVIAGSIGNFIDGRLYVIDLKAGTYSIVDEDVDMDLTLVGEKLYYNVIESFETMKINSKIVDVNSLITAENNEKNLVSEREFELFKQKYNISSGDANYRVDVNNVEHVDNKVYYLLEISKYEPNASAGWRDGYRRIASEMYIFDKETNHKQLLYLYKASDKDQIEDEEVYPSGEVEEEPLAENEMYLEIKLSDKGLKNEFDVRVEEVGGLIIGKRIEYEGKHTRQDGTIKIKVTKEIGAMITVYIDNKIDSQMLIEE